MKLKTAVILCIVTLLAACGGAMRYEAELDRAEALMEERPDSALAILESVKPADIASIESEEERARFALLYSQALDKNYIDLTTDSIISIAVEYYNNNGTPYQQFLSLFYLGRVNENAKNYLNAMRCYLKAERLVNDFDDDNLKGLLYIGIATIYRHYYDFKNTAVAFNMAYSYFDKSRKIYHRNYSRLNEAFAYSNLHEYDRSINLIKDVIDDAIADDDTIIIKSAMRSLIMIYVGQQQITQANQLYQKYISQYNFNDAGPSAIAAIALLHTFNGDTIEAKRYLKSAWCKSSTLQDTIDIYSYSERINKHSGNYTSAYDDFLRWRVRQDSYVKKSLEQPVLSAQRDYYSHEAQTAVIKAKNNRLISIIITCIGAMIIVVIVTTWIIYSSHKRRQLNETLQKAQTMVDCLNVEQETKFTILNSHIKTISNICDTYYDISESKEEIDHVKKRLHLEISNITRNDEIYNQIKNIVNRNYPNLFDTLEMELPELSRLDIETIYYFASGMTFGAICVLTNTKNGALRTRKSRVKEKIRHSSFAQKELLLSLLP